MKENRKYRKLYYTLDGRFEHLGESVFLSGVTGRIRLLDCENPDRHFVPDYFIVEVKDSKCESGYRLDLYKPTRYSLWR